MILTTSVDFKHASAPALMTRLTVHVNSELIRDQYLMRMSPDMQLEENCPKKRGGLLWAKAFGRFRFAIGPKPAYTPPGLCKDAELDSTAFYTQTARVSTHWIGLGVFVQVDPLTDITGLELICKGHEHPNHLIGYALPGGRSRQEILEIHLRAFKFLGILAKFARSEHCMTRGNLVGLAGPGAMLVTWSKETPMSATSKRISM
jgi:hypothetical protein